MVVLEVYFLSNSPAIGRSDGQVNDGLFLLRSFFQGAQLLYVPLELPAESVVSFSFSSWCTREEMGRRYEITRGGVVGM
jgi:hypothetical protein